MSQLDGCSDNATMRGAAMPIAARTLNIAQRNADRRFLIAALNAQV